LEQPVLGTLEQPVFGTVDLLTADKRDFQHEGGSNVQGSQAEQGRARRNESEEGGV
jgi:hypothetical protein